MFAAPEIYQDSKDDIKSPLPLKTNNSGTGLSSLDNFTQPADRLESKKSVSKVNQSCSKILLGEKGSSEPKIKAQEAKASHKDFLTDVRKLMLESNCDYEDLLSILDIISDMFEFKQSDNESPPPLRSLGNFQAGLKLCSLDNFTQPAGTLESEKSLSKVDQSYSRISVGEKENSKPKIKAQGAKAIYKDFSAEERKFMPESESYNLDFSDFSLPLPEYSFFKDDDDDRECFSMPDLEFPLQRPIVL